MKTLAVGCPDYIGAGNVNGQEQPDLWKIKLSTHHDQGWIAVEEPPDLVDE